MDWIEFINNEKKKDYYKELNKKLIEEYNNYVCYPNYSNIFYAFEKTKFSDVKVVILGQDPYHEPNQAHGLAFSVLNSKFPPSLRNIYKEIEDDIGIKFNPSGNLTYLANQGVFLLNTILTVRQGEAFSHKDIGWNIFTDNVIMELNKRETPIVFILWGAPAQKKKKLITNKNHFIIESNHPSPLSAYRGFFGSKPFSRTNEFLKSKNLGEINWIEEELS